MFYITDPTISALICRLEFLCSDGIRLHALVQCIQSMISFGKTSGPTMKRTDSGILPQVVSYEVGSRCGNKANQIGYGSGGGTINYIIQIKSTMVLIKLIASHSKNDLILKSGCLSCPGYWLNSLNYIGKCIFQQPTAWKISKCSIHYAQT